jgi:hypothetical protein
VSQHLSAPAELLASLLPRSRDEAWKYTPARRLFEGLAPAELSALQPAAPAPPDADRDAWGLQRVVDGLTAPIDRTTTDDVVQTGRGLSAARQRWAVPAGDHLLVQRFAGEGTFLAEDALHLAPGAHVTHVRVVDSGARAYHGGFVSVQVAEGASYTLVSFVGGGVVTRVDVAVRLRGAGATTSLAGLCVIRGESHVDHHLAIHHDAPSCTSGQDFRALVDDAARSVFTGRVVVRRGADGADAAQIHRALLLSDRAVANARPQLEIHTDAVKASHGTAVGSLDPEALFYLRQRGLDPTAARELLVEGFAATTVERAPEALRESLHAQVRRWRS